MKRIVWLRSRYYGVFVLIIPLILGAISLSEAQVHSLCLQVTKVCTDANGPGEPIEFYGTVTNCSPVTLYHVIVTDDHAGLLLGPITLEPEGSAGYTGSYIPQESPSTNIVTATGVHRDITVQAIAEATCEIKGHGGQGCTPGYWKNHLEDWAPTGYSPEDSFFDIFGVDLGFATLWDAINAKGGGVKKLARHGTAALLNAAHPDVTYPLDADAVVAAVQAGTGDLLDLLADYNELGCSLE